MALSESNREDCRQHSARALYRFLGLLSMLHCRIHRVLRAHASSGTLSAEPGRHTGARSSRTVLVPFPVKEFCIFDRARPRVELSPTATPEPLPKREKEP